MKPGRELDTLVAEKIFGFFVTSTYSDDPWPRSGMHYAGGCPLKSYSSDMRAAWELVEKIQSTPFDEKIFVRKMMFGEFQIHAAPIWNEAEKKNTNIGWEAGWGSYGCDADFGFEVSAKAETAPHAICLAALKAVGVEV